MLVVGGIEITAAPFRLCLIIHDLFMRHWVIFAGVVVLMINGIIYDSGHIHSAVRIPIQIGIGCTIYFEGNLSSKSLGDIWFIGDLGFRPYSLMCACIAVFGGVNEMNGVKGLCVIILVSALIWLSDMAYFSVLVDVLALSLVMIVALSLRASPGRYRGGTQALTFVTSLWILIVSLVDIAGVIWWRSRGSRWPVDSDSDCLHYIMVDRGYTTESIVSGLVVVSLMLGGLWAFFHCLGTTESWSYVAFMFVCVAYFLVNNCLSLKT